MSNTNILELRTLDDEDLMDIVGGCCPPCQPKCPPPPPCRCGPPHCGPVLTVTVGACLSL